MSIMVELVGFLGGMIREYAEKRRWSVFEVLLVMFFTFFTLFLVYVLLFPPVRGLLVGVVCAAAFGGGAGVFSVLLMYCDKWLKKLRARNYE